MYKPSIDDMLAGKQSRYSLVIAVAKRAREISDDFKQKGVILDDKPVLMAVEDFKDHKYEILEKDDEELEAERAHKESENNEPSENDGDDAVSDDTEETEDN